MHQMTHDTMYYSTVKKTPHDTHGYTVYYSTVKKTPNDT